MFLFLVVNHERVIYTTRKTFINLKKILFIVLLDHFLFAKFIEFCQHYNIAIFPLKCSYWLLQYLKLKKVNLKVKGRLTFPSKVPKDLYGRIR